MDSSRILDAERRAERGVERFTPCRTQNPAEVGRRSSPSRGPMATSS